MSYEFVKVYADLVSDDGTVLVLYQAWVRFFGRWHARGGLELYPSNGRHRVSHGKIASSPPLPEHVLEGPLALRLPSGDFQLVLDRREASFEPSPQPCAGLEWRVLAARTSACTRGAASLAGISGIGYVDWVRIARPIRSLGLRDLRWGRAHLPSSTFVFNAIEFADGTRWSRAVRWPRLIDAPGTVSNEVEIGTDGIGRISLGPQALKLEPERLLSRGSSFARDRFPNLVDRAVVRVVGGRARERRWIGSARLDVSAAGEPSLEPEPGSAVYERVQFG